MESDKDVAWWSQDDVRAAIGTAVKEGIEDANPAVAVVGSNGACACGVGVSASGQTAARKRGVRRVLVSSRSLADGKVAVLIVATATLGSIEEADKVVADLPGGKSVSTMWFSITHAIKEQQVLVDADVHVSEVKGSLPTPPSKSNTVGIAIGVVSACVVLYCCYCYSSRKNRGVRRARAEQAESERRIELERFGRIAGVRNFEGHSSSGRSMSGFGSSESGGGGYGGAIGSYNAPRASGSTPQNRKMPRSVAGRMGGFGQNSGSMSHAQRQAEIERFDRMGGKSAVF